MNDCIYQIERTKEEARVCDQDEEEVALAPVSPAPEHQHQHQPPSPPDSPELKSLTPTEVFSVDLNEQFRS